MATNDAKKVFTLDDIATADGTRYDTVDAHGGTWKIGTLCSGHVIEWTEARKPGTQDAKLDASMLLIARSLVFGDLDQPESLVRVPDERVQEVAAMFKAKDDTENGKIVEKILKLNDFLKKADDTDRGNASGGATSGASPTA